MFNLSRDHKGKIDSFTIEFWVYQILLALLAAALVAHIAHANPMLVIDPHVAMVTTHDGEHEEPVPATNQTTCEAYLRWRATQEPRPTVSACVREPGVFGGDLCGKLDACRDALKK